MSIQLRELCENGRLRCQHIIYVKSTKRQCKMAAVEGSNKCGRHSAYAMDVTNDHRPDRIKPRLAKQSVVRTPESLKKLIEHVSETDSHFNMTSVLQANEALLLDTVNKWHDIEDGSYLYPEILEDKLSQLRDMLPANHQGIKIIDEILNHCTASDSIDEIKKQYADMLDKKIDTYSKYVNILHKSNNTYDAMDVRMMLMELMNRALYAVEPIPQAITILQGVFSEFASKHSIRDNTESY